MGRTKTNTNAAPTHAKAKRLMRQHYKMQIEICKLKYKATGLEQDIEIFKLINAI